MMAFRQASGELAWKAGDFTAAPAAPILIDVDGQQQLVVFGGDEIVGLDPGSGQRLWSHPHKTEWGLNASTSAASSARADGRMDRAAISVRRSSRPWTRRPGTEGPYDKQ